MTNQQINSYICAYIYIYIYTHIHIISRMCITAMVAIGFLGEQFRGGRGIRRSGPRPLPRPVPLLGPSLKLPYEEFARLAETRLALNTSDYIQLAKLP